VWSSKLNRANIYTPYTVHRASYITDVNSTSHWHQTDIMCVNLTSIWIDAHNVKMMPIWYNFTMQVYMPWGKLIIPNNINIITTLTVDKQSDISWFSVFYRNNIVCIDNIYDIHACVPSPCVARRGVCAFAVCGRAWRVCEVRRVVVDCSVLSAAMWLVTV